MRVARLSRVLNYGAQGWARVPLGRQRHSSAQREKKVLPGRFRRPNSHGICAFPALRIVRLSLRRNVIETPDTFSTIVSEYGAQSRVNQIRLKSDLTPTGLRRFAPRCKILLGRIL